MKAVKPEGFPTDWKSSPIWSMYRRVSRKHDGKEPHLSVYRDLGVVSREGRTDNWNRVSEDTSGYQLVLPGDLVVNKMKAWQGSMGVSKLRGVVSPAYFVYEPLHQMDHLFMHHLLRSKPFIDAYGQMSKGIRVGQWDLDPWAFSRVPVSFPPAPDQARISHLLETKLQKLDAVIEKQQALIEGFKRRRKAIILSAVETGLPGAHSNLNSGGAWTGKIPTSWDVAQLRRLVRTISGVGFPIDYQGVEGEAYPFYKVNSLNRADSDGVIRFREDSVSPEIAQQLGARVVPSGSIVMAKVGAALLLGRVRLIDTACCIDNNMVALEVNERADPRFMYYALHRLEMNLLVNPGAIPSLSEKTLRSYPIPLPPLDEQRHIADHLDLEISRVDALIARSERLIELSQERRSALITAAVTGQIDITSDVKALEGAA